MKCFVRSRATTLPLLGLIILALWLGSRVFSQRNPQLPAAVADYGAYLSAAAAMEAEQYGSVLAALEPVWKFDPRSPVLGRAAILAARAHIALDQKPQALALLGRYQTELPQPDGLVLLARAGEGAAAAAAWQRVYYEFPRSEEAREAETELARLRDELGFSYPPPLPQTMIARAEALAKAGRQTEARREYEQMVPLLAGRDRDIARVRARGASHSQLAALQVADPAADAERLYLIHAAARRAKLESLAEDAVRQLGERHRKSPWRMEALVSLGNMYLLRNDAARYVPAYEECYRDFPAEARAAYCHWKVAWHKHLTRSPGAPEFLRAHLERFPSSEKSSAALYFLGRRAEVAARYPLSSYAMLAPGKAPSAALKPEFEPDAALRTRTERAALLETAGLAEWAEVELKFAAQYETKPFAAALALAELVQRRGAHDQGIRYIKSFAKGYLSIPLESAPERFWRAAFPIPYRAPLEQHSRARGLDPFLVAALIRQESEFNPNAISRARAYGLTQVLPSTGRQLSRRVGLGSFSPSMLFQPDVNLNLGTFYLRDLLDRHDGEIERTLASYNAGKSRTDEWLTWGEFREPAEFVETIPFTETRDYVQIVLRNAGIYRRLYGGR